MTDGELLRRREMELRLRGIGRAFDRWVLRCYLKTLRLQLTAEWLGLEPDTVKAVIEAHRNGELA